MIIGTIVKSIFSNPASIYFFGALLAWGTWAGYSWLDNRDKKIEARVEAKHTAAELQRAEQARDIYANEVSKMLDNQERDQKAIAELQTYSETQRALVNETLRQLDTVGGNWATTIVPTNRQRVLAISLERLKAATDISDEGNGTTAGRAVTGLRDRIIRSSDRATTFREGDRK